MSHRPMPDHVPPEELDRYFGGELDEDGESRVEEHLAGCRECSARAREIRALRHTIDELTAEAHGAVFWRARLESAVGAAAHTAAGAAWSDRLGRWRERWVARAEGVALVVADAGDRAARLVTGGLEDLLRPGATWRFEPIPARAMRVRGAAAKPATVSSSEIQTAGAPRVVIQLSPRPGAGHTLVVRVQGLHGEGRPPLVVLVPESGEPMVREPSFDPAATEHIATFEDPPSGRYMVALEPPGA